MSYFPELGDSVKITRGRHTGKIAVVKTIDISTPQPLYVVDPSPDLLFADWLSPHDVEPVASEPEPVVSKIPPMRSWAIVSAEEADQMVKEFKEPVVSETKPAVRRIIGRKIASAATIDAYPPGVWRVAVAAGETYLGYTAWIDAIENGEDT